MKKRVFIVHRWGGNPKTDWYPWLKKHLEASGFLVSVPSMPNTEEPEIDAWVDHLRKEVGKLDTDTYFVGHSIGCQTILRYLAQQSSPCGAALFIAPWFNLLNLETTEEKVIAHPWVTEKINFPVVLKNLPDCVAIFSEDDPWVSLKDAQTFRNKLNATVMIERDKGHFTSEDGFTELPIALTELLQLAS